jgi:hypothetical protein
MAVRTVDLTPAAVAADDYDIAQGPALGAERDVYLTTKPSRFLGILTFKANANASGSNGSYERVNSPSGTDPILAFVMTELKADVAAVVQWNGLTGTFTPVAYSRELGFDFPATRGVELVGTEANEGVGSVTITTAGSGYTSAPTVTFTGGAGTGAAGTAVIQGGAVIGVTITDPGSGYTSAPVVGFTGGGGTSAAATASLESWVVAPRVTNVKRGTKIGFVQVPAYTNFTKVGLTTAKDITVPSRTAKVIGSGMDSSRHVKPGKTSEGSLRISARETGSDEGLNRYAGLKCQAMVELMKEEAIVTTRQFCTCFVPPLRNTNGDQDEASSNESEGFFQHMITLLAPGS